VRYWATTRRVRLASETRIKSHVNAVFISSRYDCGLGYDSVVADEPDAGLPDNGDIKRVARALIAKHGGKAAAVAEARAQCLLEAGELAAHKLWKRLVQVIQELQS
jgi:hypothetical protein